MIRPLDPVTDAEAVLDLYRRAADYVAFESGREVGNDLVEQFFSDAPPGGDPATSLKFGCFQGGRLLGLVDVAFGYPERRDAYLGLMLLAGEGRGRAVGRRILRQVEEEARRRGAKRLLLAVLEGNARGRAFWEREGFGSPLSYPPARIDVRTHVRVRLEKPL
jgi:GNAT superfamily N-acetyltransferase